MSSSAGSLTPMVPNCVGRDCQLHALDAFIPSNVSAVPLIDDLRKAFRSSRYQPDKLHCHDYYEVFVARQGTGGCILGGKTIEVGTGICVLPPNFPHAWNNFSELDGHVIRIPTSFLRRIASERNFQIRSLLQASRGWMKVLPQEELQPVLSLLNWHAQPIGGSAGANDDFLESRWVAFALYLNGLMPAESTAPGSGNAKSHQLQVLIDAHFADRWSVSDYAEALGVSRSTLLRISRLSDGLTPQELIEQRTMREARRLLLDTSGSCGGIGYLLGYGDQASFTRAFKAHFGVSPGAFRRSAHKN